MMGCAKAADQHDEDAKRRPDSGWAWAAAAIIVELGGSICVIFNRIVWLGAGGLRVLTSVAMLAANDFWSLAGAARFMALNSLFEHLGLIAALVMATILAGAGACIRKPSFD